MRIHHGESRIALLDVRTTSNAFVYEKNPRCLMYHYLLLELVLDLSFMIIKVHMSGLDLEKILNDLVSLKTL